MALVLWAGVLFSIAWGLARFARRNRSYGWVYAGVIGLLGGALPLWLHLVGAMRLSWSTILPSMVILAFTMGTTAGILYPRWFPRDK